MQPKIHQPPATKYPKTSSSHYFLFFNPSTASPTPPIPLISTTFHNSSIVLCVMMVAPALPIWGHEALYSKRLGGGAPHRPFYDSLRQRQSGDGPWFTRAVWGTPGEGASKKRILFPPSIFQVASIVVDGGGAGLARRHRSATQSAGKMT